jgi:hypothetical protein
VEAVEAACMGHERRTLGLEDLPDGLVPEFGVRMRLGVGDAVIEEDRVQLLEALHPQPRRGEALAHEPDLVLDLPLLPTRGRRAGDRIDQVMAAHLQEAPVIGAFAADEDRVDRRLHVVVDAALAGALEEGEGPVVGVEHHLLALAWIGPHEHHAGMAEPDVRNLHLVGHAVDQHDLVAPVELIGLPGREGERHVGVRRDGGTLASPGAGISTDRVVAAIVTQTA